MFWKKIHLKIFNFYYQNLFLYNFIFINFTKNIINKNYYKVIVICFIIYSF